MIECISELDSENELSFMPPNILEHEEEDQELPIPLNKMHEKRLASNSKAAAGLSTDYVLQTKGEGNSQL